MFSVPQLRFFLKSNYPLGVQSMHSKTIWEDRSGSSTIDSFAFSLAIRLSLNRYIRSGFPFQQPEHPEVHQAYKHQENHCGSGGTDHGAGIVKAMEEHGN